MAKDKVVSTVHCHVVNGNGRAVEWYFRTEDEADAFACGVVTKVEPPQIATVSSTPGGAWRVSLRQEFDA